jgi:hypothetical protein
VGKSAILRARPADSAFSVAVVNNVRKGRFPSAYLGVIGFSYRIELEIPIRVVTCGVDIIVVVFCGYFWPSFCLGTKLRLPSREYRRPSFRGSVSQTKAFRRVAQSVTQRDPLYSSGQARVRSCSSCDLRPSVYRSEF